jgi:hypothetical protein
MSAERNTHLLDWLSDGHTHCQHGTKEWCEAYLHNARDVISAQDAALVSTQEEIARLRKALEPFAALDMPADEKWTCGTFLIQHEDLRTARSLLPSKPIAANPLPGEQG